MKTADGYYEKYFYVAPLFYRVFNLGAFLVDLVLLQQNTRGWRVYKEEKFIWFMILVSAKLHHKMVKIQKGKWPHAERAKSPE